MTISLYEATVPGFKKTLDCVMGLLVKAEEFASAKGLAPEALLQARLADDMWPFASQVFMAAANSWGHIEKILASGGSTPNLSPPPADFAGLKACVASAIAGLESVKPADIDALVGKEIGYLVRDHQVFFTGQDFFFTFALANFYFHVTTAYDILRWKGVPLAKKDYLGKMRMRG